MTQAQPSFDIKGNYSKFMHNTFLQPFNLVNLTLNINKIFTEASKQE